MILAGSDQQFERLVRALELPELAGDERFASNELRVRHRDALRPLLDARLATRTRDDWRQRLTAVGVSAGPVQTIDEAFSLADALGLPSSTRPAVCGRSRSRPPCRRRRRRRVYRHPTSTSTAIAVRAWLRNDAPVSDTEGV